MCAEQLSCSSTQQRQIVGKTALAADQMKHRPSVSPTSLYQLRTKQLLAQRKQQISASNCRGNGLANLTSSVAYEAVAGAKKAAEFSIQFVAQTILPTAKCEILKTSVEFLGQQICRGGMTPTVAKLKAVRDWTIPEDVKGMRSFLVFVNY